MPVLEVQQIRGFKERFYSFYDSVIRFAEVVFRSGSKKAEARVTLSVRDSKSENGDMWVNLCFRILDITEFTLHESSRASYQVLSNGLHIKHIADVFFFEFGDCTDEPEGVEEIRRSKFYIAGRVVEWEVTSYQE